MRYWLLSSASLCLSIACLGMMLSPALAASPIPTTPEAAHGNISFNDALSQLILHHPRILAAEAELARARAAQTEARSGFLPRVDIAASSGYENIDRTDLKPAGDKTNENANSYNATVTQNLFQGYRDQTAVSAASISTEAASFTLDTTRQQILYEGASAYLEVLRYKTLSKLALDNQKRLQEQLHMEDERVKRGSGIAVDALQAKSRLQVSKERYTAFMGGLQDALSRYTQIFGTLPNPDVLAIPALPMNELPKTVDEAVALAQKANPQLAATERNMQLAEKARTTARSGYYPSLDLVANSSYEDDVTGVLGTEVDNSVKLEARWQLFSGFADKSRVAQAAHRYESAKENTEYTVRKTAEEVRLAWSSVNTSKERLELLENAVNIAGEVYDARKRLRDVGSESAINVLDSENELYRARIDAASAEYDYYIALYRLLLSMGILKTGNT